MISQEEIRRGNYVLAGLQIGCEEFSEAIIKIPVVHEDSVGYGIDYPDSDCIEGERSGLNHLKPIPLNKKWRHLLRVDFSYPFWIKSVHEFQNWYYWINGKKELDTSRVPRTEGDNVPHEMLEELLKRD